MNIEDNKYLSLLDSFMRGDITHEDERILLEWFNSDEAQSKIYSYYEGKWENTFSELSLDIQMRMYENIHNKLNNSLTLTDVSPTSKRNHIIPNFVRYIAAVCIILLVGFSSYYIAQEKAFSSKEFVVSVDKGQKATLTLPDGTLVSLNSASKIKYDNSYNRKQRRIILEGEAYFEVAKDKDRPFIVTANNIDVEALGTSFNVKSYSTEGNITVTLVEGKLRVSNDISETFLKPNERLVYDKRTESFDKKNTYDVSNVAAWRNNELAFYGETLEDIGHVLSRIYNIDIVFTSESAKHYSFSGVIRNNSLNNVMEIISMTAPIKYKVYKDTIEISTNN